MPTRIAVFGLGEAGALFARDLAELGASVTGFDPRDISTPQGVVRASTPQEAVLDCEAVLALTAMSDAMSAVEQALEQIPESAIYADFSSSLPSLKQDLASRVARRGILFADVALMSTVPGKGIRTPALLSGSGAHMFSDIFSPLGMDISVVGESAGDAATRKLLRSIFLKGWAGLAIEAMRAGHQAGLGDWLWDHLRTTVANSDAGFFDRLVEGTGLHAKRRLDEMKAAQAMLHELGIEPIMTNGTIANLEHVLAEGLPVFPSASHDASAGK